MEGYFSKNQSLKIDLSFKSQLIFPKFLGLKEKSSQKVWIGVFGFPLKNGFCSPKSTFESHITFVHFHCPKEDPKKRSQNDNSKLILSVAPRKKIYSSGPFSKAVFLPFSWSDIFLNRKVVYRKGSEKVVLWKVCEITKPRLFQRVYSKTGSALTGWLRWPKVTWKNTNPSEGMSNSQNQGFSRSLFRSRVCPLRVGFADRNWPEKHSPLKGYFFFKIPYPKNEYVSQKWIHKFSKIPGFIDKTRIHFWVFWLIPKAHFNNPSNNELRVQNISLQERSYFNPFSFEKGFL